MKKSWAWSLKLLLINAYKFCRPFEEWLYIICSYGSYNSKFFATFPVVKWNLIFPLQSELTLWIVLTKRMKWKWFEAHNPKYFPKYLLVPMKSLKDNVSIPKKFGKYYKLHDHLGNSWCTATFRKVLHL